MIYTVSDLHGYLDDWKRLLKLIRFNDKDTMFVIGDCVDFGPDSIGLLHEMMQYPNVFPILGNHDLRFARCARMIPAGANLENFSELLDEDARSAIAEWAADGGQGTLAQYLALDEDEREDILDYIGEMTLYEEIEADGVHFVMTHSGIADFDEEKALEDYPPAAFLTAKPVPGMEYFSDKTVIVGHVPTFRLEGGKAGQLLDDGGIIYIDCGAAHREAGGRIGCLRLDDFEEFYID